MSELPRALRWYLWAVYLATLLFVGDALLMLVLPNGMPHLDVLGLHHTSMVVLIAFVALSYVGERTTLSVTPAISQSLSTAVHVAAILVLPAPFPVLTTLAAVLLWQARETRKPLYKRGFNVCHPTLTVALSAALCARVVTPTAILHPGQFSASLPMVGMLLLLYYLFDVAILLAVISLLQRRPFWLVWWDTYRLTLLPELAASTIGILGATTWLFDPVALILVILPVIALRVAFRAISQAEDRAAALRRRGEQLEAVLKAGQRLRLQHTQATLLHTMAEAARILAGTEVVTGYLRNPDDPTQLERIVQIPFNGDEGGPAFLPIANVSSGIREDGLGDGSVLLVPLELEDEGMAGLLRLVGIPGDFSQNDRDALGILATQATIALQNALLHERALAQASADGLTGLLNHKSFQTRLAEEVGRATRSGRVLSVMMVDLDDFKSVNNTYGHQTGDALLTAVAGVLRASARTGDLPARYGGDEFAIILPETNLEESLSVAERIRVAIAGLRVLDGGIPIGISASIGVAALPLHAQTREALIRAADQAAYAAKHTGKGKVCRPEDATFTLDQDPYMLARRLENANMAAVEALAAAVDAKDPYTRGHSQRVSAYAGALAMALGIDARDVARVRLAGLLHDVGKIGVPDAVLTKQGRLSDEEFEIIKQHPAIGERMLSQVPFLSEVLPAVRHHHERWDGRGYPDGLAGCAIPRDAAILMVADSFDAMTSSRTYRAALPLEEACRRVREGGHTQFDPMIVAAFDKAIAQETLRVLASADDAPPAAPPLILFPAGVLESRQNQEKVAGWVR